RRELQHSLVDDVDDVSLGALGELGRKGLGKEHRSADVRIELSLPDVLVQRAEQAPQENRRAVDGEGKRADRLDRLRHKARERACVSKIGATLRRLSAGPLNFTGKRLSFSD